MNGTTDKIKGMANEGAGVVKQGAGNAIGNPNLEVEGALRKGEGEAQQAVGKAKDAVKKVIDVHHPSYSKPSRQNRCRIRQSKSISLSKMLLGSQANGSKES